MEEKSVIGSQKVVANNYQLVVELKKHKAEADAYSTKIKNVQFPLMECARSAYRFSLSEFSLLVFPDESHSYYREKRAVSSSSPRISSSRFESFLAFSSLFGFSLHAYVDFFDSLKEEPKEYEYPYDAKLTKLFADSSVRAKREMALALSKDERLSETVRAYAAELASQPYLEASFDPQRLKDLIWNRQKSAQEFASHGDECFAFALYLGACFGLPRVVISDLTLGESASMNKKYRSYSPAAINGKVAPRMPTIEEFTNLCLLFGYDIPTANPQKLLSLDSIILPYLVLTGLNPKSAADMIRVALDFETNSNQRRTNNNMLSLLEKGSYLGNS